MKQATDTSSEEYRRIREARTYLRAGCTTPATVAELIARIEQHRGRAAAAELHEEMRRQWRTRSEWLRLSGERG